jgi:hypothetical protein
LVDTHKIDDAEQLRHLFAWGKTFKATGAHKTWDEDRKNANNVKTFGEYYGFKDDPKVVAIDIKVSDPKKDQKNGSDDDGRTLEGSLEKKVPINH